MITILCSFTLAAASFASSSALDRRTDICENYIFDDLDDDVLVVESQDVNPDD